MDRQGSRCLTSLVRRQRVRQCHRRYNLREGQSLRSFTNHLASPRRGCAGIYQFQKPSGPCEYRSPISPDANLFRSVMPRISLLATNGTKQGKLSHCSLSGRPSGVTTPLADDLVAMASHIPPLSIPIFRFLPPNQQTTSNYRSHLTSLTTVKWLDLILLSYTWPRHRRPVHRSITPNIASVASLHCPVCRWARRARQLSRWINGVSPIGTISFILGLSRRGNGLPGSVRIPWVPGFVRWHLT